MQKNSNASVIFTTIIATLILLLGMYVSVGLYPEAQEPQVIDVPTAAEIAALIVIPTIDSNPSLDNSKIDAIYDDIFRDENAEDVAEELALDEIDSKDFKIDLADFLDGNNSLEIDYKDIIEINVRDIDVNVTGDTATVKVEFKVYVANYGDEDEEEKARVSVIFDVIDLEEDDDYEDAEVSNTREFTLIKFYD